MPEAAGIATAEQDIADALENGKETCGTTQERLCRRQDEIGVSIGRQARSIARAKS